MRALKLWTTVAFVFGIVLLLISPWVIGPRPVDPTRQELARYGVRALTYFGVTCIAFLGAATGAMLIARRMRREAREERMGAIKELIEGSLRDHKRAPEAKADE